MTKNYREEVKLALAAAENVAGEMSQAADSGSLDARRHMIHIRTALAARYATLASTIEEARSASQDREIQELLTEASKRASAFRRAISLHQARWPTVIIGDDMATYQSESQKVRGLRDEFFSWIDTILLPRL